MMSVIINGEARDVPAGTTVADFLAERGLHDRMVVVERNGDILARDLYAETDLSEGDVLEIVQMMAGG